MEASSNITPKIFFGKRERYLCLLIKGHAGIGLYCVISYRGFFAEKHLFELNNGGLLGEHPDANITGIEVVEVHFIFRFLMDSYL